LQRITSWLCLEPLLAVILWGGIYPGVKLGLRDILLLSLTSLRILLALLILFAVSQRRQAAPLPRALWGPMLRAGLAQTVLQGLLVASLQWTTAGNSAILLATAPLLTAGWYAGTGRAQLGPRQWYGFVLGFVGVSLVIQGSSPGLAWSHLGGNLLALGTAGAWAWYGVAIGPLVGTLGSARATGWTMVVAGLCFTSIALSEVQRHTWGERLVGSVDRARLWGDSRHGRGDGPVG
jgi:drug/metabolite transporter (DMT)-like permease